MASSAVVVRLTAVVLLLVVVAPAIAVDAARLNGAMSPAGASEAEVAGLQSGIMQCLRAVGSLQSCMDEILHFLFNDGKSSPAGVGAGCCHAVKTITDSCWPGMLNAVGITSKQADELLDHCTASFVKPPPAVVPKPSVPTPAPASA